jgi:tetratricopeptide (TPR) repeat protein
MGVLRRMQNRLTEARSEFEKTIALDPNDARALYHLGVTLMFLGQPEAGIPHIQNAVRRDPHDPNITTLYWALGTCHLLLGQADEAIEFLGKARAANSRLWFPHLYLAGALSRAESTHPIGSWRLELKSSAAQNESVITTGYRHPRESGGPGHPLRPCRSVFPLSWE